MVSCRCAAACGPRVAAGQLVGNAGLGGAWLVRMEAWPYLCGLVADAGCEAIDLVWPGDALSSLARLVTQIASGRVRPRKPAWLLVCAQTSRCLLRLGDLPGEP